MKHTSLLTAILFIVAGCDAANQGESNSSPALAGDDQLSDSRTVDTAPGSDGPAVPSEQLVFNITDTAKSTASAVMESVPGSTHLVVIVDVDDEKYCTGFHYKLKLETNPSKLRFAMTESNGIKLAIEKDDLKFLQGTTLDFATLDSGERGFVFRNPNENESLPEELREK